MMKRLFLLLTTWCCVHAMMAQAVMPPCDANSPKREVRAVWLTTLGGMDWPHTYARTDLTMKAQQQELCQLLDAYQKAGINTVLIQTRTRGTMIYPSAYEPWAPCLSGITAMSPGYDALKFAIEQCHKRGMECHAWVVTIPIGKWQSDAVKRLRKKFPHLILHIGEDAYMNPEKEETGDYISTLCEEIVRNYDVDGIHLDYIRYPETWKKTFDRAQGRHYVTSIVQKIHRKVKAVKPWVKMSCSPVGKSGDLTRYNSLGWNAYTKVCQDAQGWLRDGLMDMLFPMMYFRNNHFYPFALDWKEQSHGRIVVPGLGIYFLSPKEGTWHLIDISREMEFLRSEQLGYCFFRGKFLTDNFKGIYDFTTEFNHYPALVPAMDWERKLAPLAPSSVKADDDNGVLTWDNGVDHSGGDYLLYNVYSSDTWPVDITKASNLVAVRLRANSVAIPRKEHRYYAVTAMDRYGNESEGKQSYHFESPKGMVKMSNELLAFDRKHDVVTLPDMCRLIDARVICIETLQGSVVATCRYQQTINVRGVKDGFYVVRAVNRKGITHRLGMVMLKRK